VTKVHPTLQQIDTRAWLTARSHLLGRPATLDDVTDADLDGWAATGFDWVWWLSVWTTSAEGRRVSRSNAAWRDGFRAILPDLTDDDIGGSGFAITAYTVPDALGGDSALARLRRRMGDRGLKLMLDFVPNHVALDHPWVAAHPERLLATTDEALAREPHNHVRLGDRVFAHGRDPYFDGWPDVVQLDYANPSTQAAMVAELEGIAARCDGVRCDMAMLVLPDVFERTWGRRPEPFWPAAIDAARRRAPGFTFLAEVYWDLEWALQQQGFDFTYDKRLYDRLRHGPARPVREHLHATLDFQERSARFLENHDEPRAAATFAHDAHRAAAVITYTVPGLRFFLDGQLTGRTRRPSPHLVRAAPEAPDEALGAFYDALLAVVRRPAVRAGAWQALAPTPAWSGNGSHDAFVAHAWQGPDGERVVVAVNHAAHASQCRVRLPFPEAAGRPVDLRDLVGPARYRRDGSELVGEGLFLDLPPWAFHVFEVAPAT